MKLTDYKKKIFIIAIVFCVIVIGLGVYYVGVTKRKIIPLGWDTQINSENLYKDGIAEFNFNIFKSDFGTPVHKVKDFVRYNAGEEDSDWDFALIVRYKDNKNYYRLMMSAERDEIVLWKPEGGFLAVKNFSFDRNNWYTVSVALRDSLINVLIDGEEVISYEDKVAPIIEGFIGMARYGNAVVFNKPPVWREWASGLNFNLHKNNQEYASDFHMKDWRGQKWIFDGNEPIASIDEKNVIIERVKLKPGYRPIGFWELFWKQTIGDDFYAKNIASPIKVFEEGDEFIFELGSTPSDSAITSWVRVKITYSNDKSSYVYDVNTSMEVNKEKTWESNANNLGRLEYLDFYPYNAIAPASLMLRGAWDKKYEWTLFNNSAGEWHYRPINHYDGLAGVSVDIYGGKYIYGAHSIVNPTIYLLNANMPNYKHSVDLCSWAYDAHFIWRPQETKLTLRAGDKFQAHYQILSTDYDTAERLFKQSFLDEIFTSLIGKELPIYRRTVNDFLVGRVISEQYDEWIWQGDYEWDKTTGVGDSYSIKLNNKGEDEIDKIKTAYVDTIGPSYFTRTESIPAGTYSVSAYVKTENMSGSYPTISIASKYPPTEPSIFEITDLLATEDWKKISFEAYLPESAGIALSLDFSGEGAVWFDNVLWELKKKDSLAPVLKTVKLVIDKLGESLKVGF